MRKLKKIFYKKRKLYAAVLISLCGLCVLCGCTKKEELVLLTQDVLETTEKAQSASDDSADMAKTGEAGADESTGAAYIVEEKRMVYVHVCGAVMSPGVYELPAGSRVYEAVRAAGGFAENAEESYVNQAQELTDGCKLLIPTVEEAENGGISGSLAKQEIGEEAGQTYPDDGRVNINTASVEELCGIPGIGATRAAAVISYREEHGSFENPEDIMQVSGIKEGTYEKIKDSIRVR